MTISNAKPQIGVISFDHPEFDESENFCIIRIEDYILYILTDPTSQTIKAFQIEKAETDEEDSTYLGGYRM